MPSLQKNEQAFALPPQLQVWMGEWVNEAQLFVGHQTGGRGSTSSAVTAFGRRQGDRGVNKISLPTLGDVRTLCKSGRLKEALHILKQHGMVADSNTYVCALQECIKSKALAQGKQVHAHIIQSGFKPNVFLLNTLVRMYAKCGSVVDARQVFEKISARELFTWNIMIAGYAKHGCGREALEIYKQMQQQGVVPDKVTFSCIVNACASLGALEKGREVHGDIIKSGIVPDIILQTALADMYAKCGSVDDAREVFDSMSERNVVSWSTMIAGYAKHGCAREAFEIYEQMQRQGVTPDNVTFSCILNACASLGALEKGREIHADIIKGRITPDIILETALADMYSKCGSVKDARQVFDNMQTQDVVAWNAMIAGYAQHGFGREACEIYERMMREGVKPNKVTFVCILNACASLGALEKAKEVCDDISKNGIASDIVLENTLVDMYAKCGSMKDARQVFDKMAEKDVISYNALIAGYAKHGYGDEAFEIYEQMQMKGVRLDNVTFICILNACASMGAVGKGKEVHADISKSEIAPDISLENTLIDMYAKCGSVKDARQVFDNMAQRDVVSWNTMIAGYTQHGCAREAFKIYEAMQQKGVTPDKVTFVGILHACASLVALQKGREVHIDISKSGIAPDIILETALADMYAKCGSLQDAHQVFNSMSQRNVVSWNAMITGYGQHGCGREALRLFEQMQQEGLKPDRITFTSLLSACSHVGLVEEGRHYFDSMGQDHGLTPTVEHFGCMVDLLGRAGRINEAEDFIDKMPMEPGASVWAALLGACRVHGDVEVAERVAKCLLKCEPQHTPIYVLLSNI